MQVFQIQTLCILIRKCRLLGGHFPGSGTLEIPRRERQRDRKGQERHRLRRQSREHVKWDSRRARETRHSRPQRVLPGSARICGAFSSRYQSSGSPCRRQRLPGRLRWNGAVSWFALNEE